MYTSIAGPLHREELENASWNDHIMLGECYEHIHARFGPVWRARLQSYIKRLGPKHIIALGCGADCGRTHLPEIESSVRIIREIGPDIPGIQYYALPYLEEGRLYERRRCALSIRGVFTNRWTGWRSTTSSNRLSPSSRSSEWTRWETGAVAAPYSARRPVPSLDRNVKPEKKKSSHKKKSQGSTSNCSGDGLRKEHPESSCSHELGNYLCEEVFQ